MLLIYEAVWGEQDFGVRRFLRTVEVIATEADVPERRVIEVILTYENLTPRSSAESGGTIIHCRTPIKDGRLIP